MKKKYLITVVCFVTAFMAYSQTPAEELMFSRSVFNDAKDIQAAATPADRDKILANYFASNADIQAFNKEYGFALTGFSVDAGTLKTMRDSTQVKAQSGSTLGILNPSIGVDALASVIAKRFKQEINIAFLMKFKEELENDKYYLGLLFPESKKVLITSDPYNYPVFIVALKEAFNADVKSLFHNIPLALDELNIGTKYRGEIYLLSKILDGTISGDIIAVVNTVAYNYSGDKVKLKKGLYSLALALNAGKKNGTGTGMLINTSDMSYFSGGGNAVFIGYYYPLLFRQNEKFIDELGLKAGDVQKVSNLINDAKNEYTAIMGIANTIQSKSTTNTLKIEDIVKSAGDIVKSLRSVAGFYKKHIDTSIDTSEFEIVLDYANTAIKLTENIKNENYGLAMVELVQIVGYACDTETEEFSRFKKYAGFIANALSAESKDDLMDALDTSANPVGSYRIKRNSTFNISVNAYAGGFAGIGPNDAMVYGFTAPVGIYAGWGNIWKEESENPLKGVDGKSFGLFVPLVDVGAVTAFRLQDEETEMADVSWGNVFAPGAYLTFGFGKCPISLNLGGQMGPELTKVNSDGKPEFVEKEWYWRAGVVVDISLFDLYTKQSAYHVPTKKQKKREEARKKREEERKLRREARKKDN